MFAVSVCHRSEQTDLREGRFVDTVNVRFGLLFNLVSVRFVTDCAVYQRLHERTQTKKWVRAGSSPFQIPHFLWVQRTQLEQPDITHPVVSELTACGVNRSLRTVGGFEVEVVVDVNRVETRLKEREGGRITWREKLGTNSRSFLW